MSLRDDDVRLRHMRDAAGKALEFAAGRGKSDLIDDDQLTFALIRCFEIVGEAATNVSEETQRNHDQIPWQAIRGMRNRLIHAYFEVDSDILWQTVTESLPELIERLEEGLRDQSPD